MKEHTCIFKSYQIAAYVRTKLQFGTIVFDSNFQMAFHQCPEQIVFNVYIEKHVFHGFH